jgi:hypothetical protein
MDCGTFIIFVFAFCVVIVIGSIIGGAVATAKVFGWKDTIRTLISILKDPFGT